MCALAGSELGEVTTIFDLLWFLPLYDSLTRENG
jgi:hypothetical protein